ncbi:MAG: DUF2461 domain-containing protein [Desulfuromonadaceae bacterium]|nr:DUF2461 domain-containing protein [Desulfuromonadaceae bacterium]MDD5105412.1 DUF2461 domain-containing protein [Desulfuromonadaceae bacterium]
MEPLKNLVSDLAGAMLAIDPDLVTIPAMDKTISRIYRDTRFSRNKYCKTCLWITFKRRSPDWKSAPCFFFEISADGYRYGMGFYSASRETMDNLRRFIEAKPAEFKKVMAAFSKQNTFTLKGDRYKRPLNPALPDDLQQWHSRKNIYFICQRPVDGRLFTKGVADDLREGFGLLKPLYEVLWRVCG